MTSAQPLRAPFMMYYPCVMHPLGTGRLRLWDWGVLSHAKAVCGTIPYGTVETGHERPVTTTARRRGQPPCRVHNRATSLDPGFQSKAGPPLDRCLTSVFRDQPLVGIGSPFGLELQLVSPLEGFFHWESPELRTAHPLDSNHGVSSCSIFNDTDHRCSDNNESSSNSSRDGEGGVSHPQWAILPQYA
ncbi:hypothetical protein J6590_020680 [Homalodisca vitripennis]|nr:hypothetical protein J6590_020680 [Homalodisca vitripennis]